MSDDQTETRDLEAETEATAREIDRVHEFLASEERAAGKVSVDAFQKVLLELANTAQDLWETEAVQGDPQARSLFEFAMEAPDMPTLDHRIDDLIRYLHKSGKIQRTANDLIGGERESRRRAAVGGNALADSHSDVSVGRQRLRL